jgi:hypothetical protein
VEVTCQLLASDLARHQLPSTRNLAAFPPTQS